MMIPFKLQSISKTALLALLCSAGFIRSETNAENEENSSSIIFSEGSILDRLNDSITGATGIFWNYFSGQSNAAKESSSSNEACDAVLDEKNSCEGPITDALESKDNTMKPEPGSPDDDYVFVEKHSEHSESKEEETDGSIAIDMTGYDMVNSKDLEGFPSTGPNNNDNNKNSI